MKPRHLKLLRIEDDFFDPENDVVRGSPVEILTQVARWLDFCKLLDAREFPSFELLTIDLNFIRDQTTPRFPPLDGSWEVDPDYLEDRELGRLAWSSRLQGSGKNTGLVIGATAVGAAVGRLPSVGCSVYTGYPDMATRDVTSTLLLGQILLASGEHLQLTTGRELVTAVVRYLNRCARDCQNALPIAVTRFREGFLRAARGERNGPSLWVDKEELVLLKAALSATSQSQLDELLDEHGVKFYDSYGRPDCLSLESLFLDRLATKDEDGLVRSFTRRLTLADVSDNANGGRAIHDFVDRLLECGSDNFRRIALFVQSPQESVNRAFPNATHRLIALLFAYCDQYASTFEQYCQPWDTLSWELDEERRCATLLTQLGALLRTLSEQTEATTTGIRLSSTESISIVKVVETACEDCDHALARPLGYSDVEHGSVNSTHRSDAIRRMLRLLEECQCVRETHELFVVTRNHLPECVMLHIDRQDLAKRLGLQRGTELGPIVEHSLNQELGEFLSDLESRPLRGYLHRLCADYMRKRWPHVPERNWPPCLESRRMSGAERPWSNHLTSRPVPAGAAVQAI